MTNSSGKGCFFWGCLIALTALILAVGTVAALVYFGFESQSSVRDTADAYLDALDRGDHDAAYQMLTPEWQERMDLERFRAIESDSRAAFGALRDRTLAGVDMRKTSGREAAARITYEADCDQGPLRIAMDLKRIEGRWLVEAVERSSGDSEGVPAALVCSRCGAISPPNANFCASCGQRLREVEQVEQPETVTP